MIGLLISWLQIIVLKFLTLKTLLNLIGRNNLINSFKILLHIICKSILINKSLFQRLKSLEVLCNFCVGSKLADELMNELLEWILLVDFFCKMVEILVDNLDLLLLFLVIFRNDFKLLHEIFVLLLQRNQLRANSGLERLFSLTNCFTLSALQQVRINHLVEFD